MNGGLPATEPGTEAEPARPGPGPGGTGPGGTGPVPDAGGAGAARARAMAARLTAGWPLRRTFGVGVVIVSLFAIAAIVLGGVALANLASARDRVVNKIDPAAFRTSQL